MRLSTSSSNASVDAVTARLAGGSLRIFSGNPSESPDTVADGQLLVELHWPTPAFPPATNGVSVSFALSAGLAVASGNPSVAQAVDANGDAVFDEVVNQGEESLHIEPAWIEAGGTVVVDHIAYSG